MTKLLVQGDVILAKDVTEDGDAIRSADQIIPKHVVEGWQIVDVEVPDGFTCAGYTFDGAGVAAKAIPASQAEKDAFIKQIDTDADAIYTAVIGNRQTEYQLAESEANSYKTAGYAGTVPSSVQCWASAKNQTAQWAADDIIATATAWRGAQAAIRANRLQRKEDVRNAATAAQLSTAKQSWESFRATIRSQLGVGS